MARDKSKQKPEQVFTKELMRRRKMTPEELAQERDKYFLEDHKMLIKNVKKLLLKRFNNLSQESLDFESSQIVGYFQSMLEYGAFIRRGEHALQNDNGAFPSTDRLAKKDLRSLTSNLQKVNKTMRHVLYDSGAWDKLQQILWNYVAPESANNTRPDLFLLQALSDQEMLLEAVEDMINEGSLFRRDKLAMKKARRMTIQRLAFLFELSMNPEHTPQIISVLENILETMTKADDWGGGKKTNPGNVFINIAQEVFEVLGCKKEPPVSGETIRKDIQDTIKEIQAAEA